MIFSKLFMTFMFLTSTSLFAQNIKSIICTDREDQFKRFSAEFDFSYYRQSSDMFVVKNASIRDNYATANLLCSTFSLRDFSVSCVGFWFDQNNSLAHVQIRSVNGVAFAQYRTLSGPYDIKGGPLKCSITDHPGE